MTHVSFIEKGQHYESSFDYVVVGSGPGGATFAKALADAGEQVCIVEAGPWRDPEHYPSSFYGGMRDGLDNFGTTFAKGKAQWPVVQAALVGGGSVINSAICVRTPMDVFEQWQRDYGFGGEALANKFWEKQDKLETLLSVSETGPEALGESNKLALKAGNINKIEHHLIKRFVKDCEGSGDCFQGCKKNKKQSMNVTFIPEVINKGGAVISCAPVHKVLFEKNRAVAVTGHFKHPLSKKKGSRFTIRANKAVIVAASATHSPALLQRSGVKHPALGQGFMSHPGGAVIGLYPDKVDMHFGSTQGWASMEYRESKNLKLETLSMPLETICGRIPGGGAELMERVKDFPKMANWVQVVRAEARGTVRNGLFNQPDVRYGLNEKDMLRFREGSYITAKLHFDAGAEYVIPGVQGLPSYITADQLDMIKNGPTRPTAYFGACSHLFGGCIMGADENHTVVDTRGKVRGYDSLYVADASNLPTNLGVNPQHTIMANAWQLAEKLLDS